MASRDRRDEKGSPADILIRLGGEYTGRLLQCGLADQPDKQERVWRAVGVHEDEVDQRCARDGASAVAEGQRGGARIERAVKQVFAGVAAEGEHGERSQ